MLISSLHDASKALLAGKIILHPTEAVYGIGALAKFNHNLDTILHLKSRPSHKGFIVLISQLSQIAQWILPLTHEQTHKLHTKVNGYNHTWLVPCNTHCPELLRGLHDTLAIRLTSHPIAASLCQMTDHAIISTSANPQGQPPARTATEAAEYFPLLTVLNGKCGHLKQPTRIQHIVTNEIFR